MMENNRRNRWINLTVPIFLVGLICFIIGNIWYLRSNIGNYLDNRPEISDFESVFYPGLYSIGIILIVFAIVIFLYDHTSKLIKLRNKNLYQIIIALSFLFTIIMEIISRFMLHNAYQNRNDDFFEQLNLSFLVSTLSRFGIIIMLIMIGIFIITLINMDKYEPIIAPDNQIGIKSSDQIGIKGMLK